MNKIMPYNIINFPYQINKYKKITWITTYSCECVRKSNKKDCEAIIDLRENLIQYFIEPNKEEF